MTEPRTADEVDLLVGAALVTLGAEQVPDHGDRFWHVLGSRLIAERSAPAAPTFDPLERLERPERADDHVLPSDAEPPGQRARRRDRMPEALDGPGRPAVSDLAEHADWVREPRPDWRRRAFVAATAAATAAALGAIVWWASAAAPASRPPTSGRVAQLMTQQLTSSPYVLGRVDTVGLGAGSGRYAFVRSSAGSFRYRSLDRRADTAYDALTGAAQSWTVHQDGSTDTSSDVGLAPGPPDGDGANQYLQHDELGSLVRALEAAPDVVARTQIRNGQKAWVIDVRLRASSDSRVDGMQVIVDQRRDLPVQVSLSVSGIVIHRTRFSDLRTTSTVGQDTFRLTFPRRISPPEIDDGFRQTTLPAASRLVGYAPATPGWLPPGYQLASVAVLRGSPQGLAATAGGDNPPDHDVVSLVYRRGLDQLTVTMRRITSPADRWEDPFVSGSKAGARVQRVRLDGGRFLATMVEQVTAPGSAPHLWGRGPDFVFTVAGDLEPSLLLKVADALA